MYIDQSNSATGGGTTVVFPYTTLIDPLVNIWFYQHRRAIPPWLPLRGILSLPDTSFTIFCSSRSTLKVLGGLYSCHLWLLKIHSYLKIFSLKRRVEFCWMKSHVVIQGNNLTGPTSKTTCLLILTKTRFPIPTTTRLSQDVCRPRERKYERTLVVISERFPGVCPSSFQRNKHWKAVLARLRIE